MSILGILIIVGVLGVALVIGLIAWIFNSSEN